MSSIVKSGGGAAKQEKTATAGTSAINVLPDTGKLLSRVVVNPTPTEEKTVTPSTSQQIILPSDGKHLSKVIMEAMEDVTPEVTAQTPVITQIAEKFGVSITTPSGTNKQILQGNNTNLQSINTNAKKAGAYVWKKYESIISFNVDGLTFQAEDGMTWQDFINSSYNNGNFSTATYSGNTYATYSNPDMAPQMYGGVLISDLIRDGVKYVTEFSGIICDPNKPM